MATTDAVQKPHRVLLHIPPLFFSQIPKVRDFWNLFFFFFLFNIQFLIITDLALLSRPSFGIAFDIDGVILLGNTPVGGSPAALRRLYDAEGEQE